MWEGVVGERTGPHHTSCTLTCVHVCVRHSQVGPHDVPHRCTQLPAERRCIRQPPWSHLDIGRRSALLRRSGEIGAPSSGEVLRSSVWRALSLLQHSLSANFQYGAHECSAALRLIVMRLAGPSNSVASS